MTALELLPLNGIDLARQSLLEARRRLDDALLALGHSAEDTVVMTPSLHVLLNQTVAAQGNLQHWELADSTKRAD